MPPDPRLVAVTGATGFVGRALVRGLRAEGIKVRALVRRPDAGLEVEGIETIQGDLQDQESLRLLVKGATDVVHCAGAIKAPNRAAFFETNVRGTERLLNAILANGESVRFLLISSLAAREPQLSTYAASKRRAEEILAAQTGPLDYFVLRPPAIYGPGDKATLPLFRQLAKGICFVPNRSCNRLSLLFVEDLVGAVLHLLGRPAWRGNIVELDDGQPGGYSWSDLAGIAGRSLKRHVRLISIPQALLAFPARVNEALAELVGRAPMLTRGKLRELFHPDWVCSPSGASILLPWRAEVRFEQGFPRTLAWYKDSGWL